MEPRGDQGSGATARRKMSPHRAHALNCVSPHLCSSARAHLRRRTYTQGCRCEDAQHRRCTPSREIGSRSARFPALQRNTIEVHPNRGRHRDRSSRPPPDAPPALTQPQSGTTGLTRVASFSPCRAFSIRQIESRRSKVNILRCICKSLSIQG